MSDPTSELTEKLRAAAKKATPGEWKHYSSPLRPGMSGINEVQCDERTPVVAWMGFDDSARPKAKHARNAAFIALASPQNILALLDANARLLSEKEALEKELAEARKALEPFAACADHLDGSEDVPRTPDDEWAKFRLLASDYRAARRASHAGGGDGN